jgi:serine/threonine protein kinase
VSLAPGTRLISYEVLAPLGQGGMGEVYKARDRKLGRDVALKILPQTFMADPGRLARFHREAQLLASLNHPHIAQIHGLEEDGGICFLVLELVDGATLAERLKQGPLPVGEAVRIARQVAEALESAHEKGIVHRDLKPANIALTIKGQVKVLDFGLARGRQEPAGRPDLTHSPTLTSPAILSGTGAILGTAAYMSPEQARGKAVDHRADIWAFGCVLYEMLTGAQSFTGDSVADVLVTILTKEPDWDRLPRATPPALRRILKGTLEKELSDRANDVASIRRQLEELSSAAETSEPSRSLAVLPFAFLNDVPERQALSLGFADALITTLGNVEDLTVAPTSAILRYAPGAEPRQVCQELGVRQALDSITEEDISQTIRAVAASQRVITILIAHRLSTIMHADRIVVLEHGRIAESGTHAALLEQKGLYYAMWRQQIGERRAAAPIVVARSGAGGA